MPNALPSQTFAFDALIVGASVAGCVAALHLANKHWRVGVLEQRSQSGHFKALCTHIIHPSGVRELKALGLWPQLEAASANPTYMQLNYQEQALYYPFGAKAEAANIERQDLDPLLRQALIKHPSITLIEGYELTGLREHGDAVKAKAFSKSSRESIDIESALVIGADGRNSRTAKLSGGWHKAAPNHRVAQFAYFEHSDSQYSYIQNSDIQNSDPQCQEQQAPLAQSRVWSFEQGKEYIGVFPNKRHILVSWYLSECKFKAQTQAKQRGFEDLEQRLLSKGVKLGPQCRSTSTAKRTAPECAGSKMPQVVLIGDAKLAADPLTGVGCAWAMSSASLLVKQLPSKEGQQTLKPSSIRWAIWCYNCLHALKFRLASSVMSFMSMHGSWIYNRPVFSLMAKLSAKRQP